MKIRKYRYGDAEAVYQLFYETVQQINRQDYRPTQLAVWAKPVTDLEKWHESFASHYAIVAEIEQELVGFADLSQSGYLDRLYVHRYYQRQGIAQALVADLEQHARERGVGQISVAASITARPFFQKNGYRLIREQQVVREGQKLTNFLLEKNL